MLLPALGIGAMAAPFMFPALGAAAGIGGPASLAGGASVGSIGALGGLGGAELAGMGLAPSMTLGASIPSLGISLPGSGGGGLSGLMNNPALKIGGQLMNAGGGGGQPQQSQPPIGAIAPPPRPQPQPQGAGLLFDAATQNLGGQYTSAPAGTVDQMDLNMISYVSQLLKQAQGGGPQFGSGTRTQSPAAGYA